ncbi:hypothetical protein EYC84_005897 [Monilinia fructicola]|uniref:Uncharacterized protein n=1 Tax=Monilinia fructicola TaxID=38448 RepID=A0A5M9K1Z4_MONFR|nr:hypothetical protein EYC84_005897 [Monilinia fructicola]
MLFVNIISLVRSTNTRYHLASHSIPYHIIPYHTIPILSHTYLSFLFISQPYRFISVFLRRSAGDNALNSINSSTVLFLRFFLISSILSLIPTSTLQSIQLFYHDIYPFTSSRFSSVVSTQRLPIYRPSLQSSITIIPSTSNLLEA